ncbi:hypothetical protein [Janibacter sp. YB324]|nr:hypothetical protein [Janibacter sp. YB324]QNF93655.1 hypothetical protein H7A72_12995 [Janibacter sp. YB324]
MDASPGRTKMTTRPRTYRVYPEGGHAMKTWGPALDDALPRVVGHLTKPG